MGHFLLRVADNFPRLRSTLNMYHARVKIHIKGLCTPESLPRGFSTWRSFVKSADTVAVLPAHLAPDTGGKTRGSSI